MLRMIRNRFKAFPLALHGAVPRAKRDVYRFGQNQCDTRAASKVSHCLFIQRVRVPKRVIIRLSFD